MANHKANASEIIDRTEKMPETKEVALLSPQQLEKQAFQQGKDKIAENRKLAFKEYRKNFYENAWKGLGYMDKDVMKPMLTLLKKYKEKIHFTSTYRSMAENAWVYTKNNELWRKINEKRKKEGKRELTPDLIRQAKGPFVVGRGYERINASAHTGGVAFDFQVDGLDRKKYETLAGEIEEENPGMWVFVEEKNGGRTLWIHAQKHSYDLDAKTGKPKLMTYIDPFQRDPKTKKRGRLEKTKQISEMALTTIYQTTIFHELLSKEAKKRKMTFHELLGQALRSKKPDLELQKLVEGITDQSKNYPLPASVEELKQSEFRSVRSLYKYNPPFKAAFEIQRPDNQTLAMAH